MNTVIAQDIEKAYEFLRMSKRTRTGTPVDAPYTIDSFKNPFGFLDMKEV
jgi:hypothetical protein